MSDNVQVVISPDLYFLKLQTMQNDLAKREREIQSLEAQLKYERSLREQLEEQIRSLTDKRKVKTVRKKRDVSPDDNAYSDFKSDGKRKPHAADSIRSYDDFYAMQQYFLNKGSVRDWAMWTIGVSLGLRVSDLLSLKFGNLVDKDKKTIKPRLQIYEQKTGKLNNCLITESVKHALNVYLESIKYEFDLDGYLFPSKKTGGKMYEECGWRILSSAGKALNLPLIIGSHTMRKSFANIAACVDRSCVDMNAVTKVQGLLNHSDQRVTMRYLGTYQEMYDRARVAVSNFVLGNSGVNEIIAGNQYTTDDVVERLDLLEKILTEGKKD